MSYARISAPESVLISVTLTGNSRAIIEDALRSVVDAVDYCLVIDTGISDDTLAIARAVAGEIVGQDLLFRAFHGCSIHQYSAHAAAHATTAPSEMTSALSPDAS